MPLFRLLQSSRMRSRLAESKLGSPDGMKTNGCDTGVIEVALNFATVYTVAATTVAGIALWKGNIN